MSSAYASARLSMRETLRSRLLRDVLGACRPETDRAQNAYVVLVLDQRATRVLNAALTAYDIAKVGVALIEGLHKPRQPFPEFEVVYVVEPTPESLAQIAADFADPKRPMYGDVHVFLTRHVRDAELQSLLQPLRSIPQLHQRIRTLCDANVDVLAVESNVFHLDMPLATIQLYSEGGMQRQRCVDRAVDCLAALCASLNEYPFIRYHAGNALTAEIANKLQTRLNDVVNSSDDFWWHGNDQPGKGGAEMRATVFLLDRKDDPVAPFLHELTYQAMVFDLIDVGDDNVVDLDNISGSKGGASMLNRKSHLEVSGAGADASPSAGATTTATVPTDATGEDARAQAQGQRGTDQQNKHVLSESDPLWTDYKHRHIVEVMEQLGELASKYGGKEIHRARQGHELTAKEMALAAQQLSEYREIMLKYQLHFKLATTCTKLYNDLRLPACLDLEQTMATGLDADGKSVTSTKLTSGLIELVQDPSVDVYNTLRLVALYIITQKGIKEADRRRIIQAANPPLPPEAQSVLINLAQLGVSIESTATSGSSSSRFGYGYARRKAAVAKPKLGRLQQAALELAKNCDYSKSRFVPVAQDVVDAFCTRSLSTNSYPYLIEPPPNLYSSDATAAANSSTNGASISGGGSGSGIHKPGNGLGSKSSQLLSARTHTTNLGISMPSWAASNGTAASTGSMTAGLGAKDVRVGGTGDGGSSSSGAPGIGPVEGSTFEGGRVIVFVAGGVTFSELRGLHQVMKEQNREIVMGATHIIRPNDMLRSLKYLDRTTSEQLFERLGREEAREAAARRAEMEAAVAGPQPPSVGATASGASKTKNGSSSSSWGICGCGGGSGSSEIARQVELPELPRSQRLA